MSDYQFSLKLEDAEGCAPEVRMWIDDQFSDLSSEHEVKLVRDGDFAWSATFEARGTFIYRVGIVARPGSHWSISFRDADGEELLFDCDDVTLAKEWLVGTCDGAEVAALGALRDASVTSALSS